MLTKVPGVGHYTASSWPLSHFDRHLCDTGQISSRLTADHPIHGQDGLLQDQHKKIYSIGNVESP